MEIAERQSEVAGLGVHWRHAGDAPVLFVHGVPTASFDWDPMLSRIGGVAPDLPGFGRSDKPGDFDYSIEGYDRFLEAFTEHVGLERFSLVVHDWGGVGLALAQRFPERIERLVLFSCVPLLPGFSWHRVARAWRTPGLGELTMGFTTRYAMRRSLPPELADRAWECFDQGTQRAILRLYRASPPEVLARAGDQPGRAAGAGAGALAHGRSLHRSGLRAALRRRPRRRDHAPARGGRRSLDLVRAPGARGARGRLRVPTDLLASGAPCCAPLSPP